LSSFRSGPIKLMAKRLDFDIVIAEAAAAGLVEDHRETVDL